jgi:hypothetical protein
MLMLSLFCALALVLPAQQMIKGTVLEADSLTALPFAYVINKSNGNGTMGDNEGRFVLLVKPSDTLVCSFVGYKKLSVPVKQLSRDAQGNVRLVMREAIVNLNTVVISTFKYKAYEREYMNEIIDKSKIKRMDYAMSPISALYMKYSKEGKQINKLAKIFENLLIEEQVQQKLSREILVRLTGDANLDYNAFRKYCYYVSDYYVISHEGVELYTRVMECYKRYKDETRLPGN